VEDEIATLITLDRFLLVIRLYFVILQKLNIGCQEDCKAKLDHVWLNPTAVTTTWLVMERTSQSKIAWLKLLKLPAHPGELEMISPTLW
jgi:hypothetical protein